jgi:hypothetical protein
MLEEEKIFSQDFDTLNMTEENMREAEMAHYDRARRFGKKAPKRH